MKFNDVYSKFITMAWDSDEVVQTEYLQTTVSDIRKIPVEYLKKQGVLFIPNNRYITHFIGNSAFDKDLNLYDQDGICLWTHNVVIPIYNLIGEIVGITGWDAGNKYKEMLDEKVALPMYKVSNKYVFSKEKYFLCDIDTIRESIRTHRTICVTDGVFDCISLNCRGIPTIGLLGSDYSEVVLAFLKFFDTIYVVADNDEAGKRLYKQLKSSVPHTFRIIQNQCKDIEEFMRNDIESNNAGKKIKTSLGIRQDIYLTSSKVKHL